MWDDPLLSFRGKFYTCPMYSVRDEISVIRTLEKKSNFKMTPLESFLPTPLTYICLYIACHKHSLVLPPSPGPHHYDLTRFHVSETTVQ